MINKVCVLDLDLDLEVITSRLSSNWTRHRLYVELYCQYSCRKLFSVFLIKTLIFLCIFLCFLKILLCFWLCFCLYWAYSVLGSTAYYQIRDQKEKVHCAQKLIKNFILNLMITLIGLFLISESYATPFDIFLSRSRFIYFLYLLGYKTNWFDPKLKSPKVDIQKEIL